MHLNAGRNREYLDLVVITVLALFFAFVSFSNKFLDTIHEFFRDYYTSEGADFLANFIFLFLLGLIFFALRLWRRTLKRQKELEDVISAISPDILLVVDGKKT